MPTVEAFAGTSTQERIRTHQNGSRPEPITNEGALTEDQKIWLRLGLIAAILTPKINYSYSEEFAKRLKNDYVSLQEQLGQGQIDRRKLKRKIKQITEKTGATVLNFNKYLQRPSYPFTVQPQSASSSSNHS